MVTNPLGIHCFFNKNGIFDGKTFQIIFHGLVDATRDKCNVILLFLTSLLLNFAESYSADFSWVTKCVTTP